MKISYRTHPVLEKLFTKELGNFKLFSCDAEMEAAKAQFEKEWHNISLGINHQIYILSQSFVDAYEKAGDKLFESNLWGEIEDDNICLITPWHEVTCLKIRNNKSEKIIYCDVFDFMQKDVITFVAQMEYYYSKDTLTHDTFGWVSNNIKGVTNEQNVLNCLLITLFIKYAQVEIKHLAAGQKEKGIDCKYKNDTKMPVNFLDSKWFTTLVKSDAFRVRGHFRLQPKKKDGEWTKELIWINEFQKTGYTAPARKLKEQL